MPYRHFVAAALAVATVALPAEAAPRPASLDACQAMRTGVAQPGAASTAGKGKPSAETAAILAQVSDAKGGSAAPNAEAQGLLGLMANMMGSRGDADSLAAADAVRRAAGKPGATASDAMAAALAKLGC